MPLENESHVSVGFDPQAPADLASLEPPHAFELLCRDLLQAQPEVGSAHQYGTPGQGQYGIDQQALLQNGGIWVAQSKKYRKTTPGLIKKSTEKFLSHWAHWKDKDVRRFILCLAADASERKCQDEIQRAHVAFHAVGIDYVVWDPRQIMLMLGHHPNIVLMRLGPYWVARLCPAPVQPQATTDGKQALVTPAIDQRLLDDVSLLISNQIQAAANRANDGARSVALADVEALATSAGFNTLPDNKKAQVFRLNSYLLINDDEERSQVLREQAFSLDHSDIDDKRLAAALHLQKGRPNAALELLTQGTSENVKLRALAFIQLEMPQRAIDTLGENQDADTRHLRAIAAYQLGDLIRAIELARPSVGEPQNDWSTQFLLGAFLTVSGIDDAERPRAITKWPQPASPLFVKHDEKSRAARVEAAAIFRDLAAAGHADAALKNQAQHWLLAAQAEDADQREAATETASALLRDNPADAAAVIWSITHNLAIAKGKTTKALVDRVRKRFVTADQVAALATLYLANQQHEKARSLIESTAPLFQNADGDALRTWQVALGIRASGDDVLGIEVVAAAKISANSDAERIEKLTSIIAKAVHVNDLPTLLEASEAALALEAGAQIVGVAPIILRVETDLAARVAAFVYLQAEHWAEAASAFEIVAARSPGGRLPARDHRARIDALFKAGDIGRATIEARTLAQDSASGEDHEKHVQMQVLSGDLRGASATIRLARSLGSLRPASAVRFSPAIAQVDEQLALDLLKDAANESLTAGQLSLAFELASRIGDTQLREQLTSAMAGFAKTRGSPIRAFSLKQLTRLMKRRRAAADIARAEYKAGRRSIHSMAAETGHSLSDLILGPTEGERDIAPYVRFGRREREEMLPLQPVAIDLTSLLTLFRIRAIDEVVATYKAIFIAPQIMDQLTAEMSAIQLPAENRTKCAELLMQMADDGKIGVFHGVSEPTEKAFADCATLQTASRGETIETEIIRYDGRIALDPIEAIQLTQEELRSLVANLDTAMSSASLDALRCNIDRLGKDLARRNELLALVEWLHKSFAIGAVTYLQTAVDAAPQPVSIQGLAACLSAAKQGHVGSICVDDRFVTRYLRVEQTSIVSSWDLLSDMELRGSINVSRRDFLQLQILLLGHRFLLPSAARIAEELTTLNRETTVEPRILQSIRKYVAGALLDENLHFALPDDPGEVEWALSINRRTIEVLTTVWSGPGRDEDKRIRSDWVHRNLWIDGYMLKMPAGADEDRRRLEPVAIQAISLLTAATQISESAEGESNRSGFVRWCTDRIIEPRLAADPSILSTLVQFATHILSVEELPNPAQLDPNIFAHAQRTMLLRLLRDFPDPIRSQLLENAELTEALDPPITTTLKVGRHTFDALEYWNAEKKALAGMPGTITSHATNQRWSIERISDVNGIPQIRLWRGRKGKREDILVADPFSVALLPIKERDESLSCITDWLDISPQIRNELVAPGIDLSDRQLLALSDETAGSIREKIGILQSRISEHAPISIKDLEPPKLGRIREHIRLPTIVGPGIEAISRASQQLQTDIGRFEAFVRLGGIPVWLPQQLAQVGRAEIVATLSGGAMSSLASSPIHLVQALRGANDGDARIITNRLMKIVDADGIELLVQLLKLTQARAQRDRSSSLDHASHIVVTWFWASKVTSMLVNQGIELRSLAEWLGNQSFGLPLDLVDGRFWQMRDAGTAERLTSEQLIASLAVHALSDRVDLDGEWREILKRKLLTTTPSSTTLPAISLLQDLSLLRNVAGIFTQAAFSPIVSILLNDEHPFGTGLGAAVEEALVRVEAGFDSGSWGLLATIVGSGEVHEEMSGRIVGAALKTDFAAAWRAGDTFVPRALTFAAEQLRNHFSNENADAIWKRLADLAREADGARNSSFVEDSGGSEFIIHAIFETAFWIAWSGPDPVEDLAKYIVGLADCWPATRRHFSELAAALSSSMPHAAMTPLRRAQLELRRR